MDIGNSEKVGTAYIGVEFKVDNAKSQLNTISNNLKNTLNTNTATRFTTALDNGFKKNTQQIRQMGRSIGQVGGVLQSLSKMALAPVAGALFAFIKTGSPQAKVFGLSIDRLKQSFSGLGEKLSKVSIFGKTISEWINSLASALNKISVAQLEKFVNIASRLFLVGTALKLIGTSMKEIAAIRNISNALSGGALNKGVGNAIGSTLGSGAGTAIVGKGISNSINNSIKKITETISKTPMSDLGAMRFNKLPNISQPKQINMPGMIPVSYPKNKLNINRSDYLKAKSLPMDEVNSFGKLRSGINTLPGAFTINSIGSKITSMLGGLTKLTVIGTVIALLVTTFTTLYKESERFRGVVSYYGKLMMAPFELLERAIKEIIGVQQSGTFKEWFLGLEGGSLDTDISKRMKSKDEISKLQQQYSTFANIDKAKKNFEQWGKDFEYISLQFASGANIEVLKSAINGINSTIESDAILLEQIKTTRSISGLSPEGMDSFTKEYENIQKRIEENKSKIDSLQSDIQKKQVDALESELEFRTKTSDIIKNRIDESIEYNKDIADKKKMDISPSSMGLEDLRSKFISSAYDYQKIQLEEVKRINKINEDHIKKTEKFQEELLKVQIENDKNTIKASGTTESLLKFIQGQVNTVPSY